MPAEDAPTILSIVGTSDLHGHVEHLPLLAGYLQNLSAVRAADGALVVVDGGDMFQGTLTSNLSEGAAVVRAYNVIGYTAATIGNHEFDYGPVGEERGPGADADLRGALKARAREASFPFLTANLFDAETGQRVQWDMPSTTMVNAAGVKVGIVGVTTIDTLRTTLASNVADLILAPLAETIDQHARDLRAAGASVVIVAAHAGGECEGFGDPNDASSCQAGEIFDVAAALEPGLVDVIVAGHTHQGIAHRVNGAAIIESYAYGVAFGRVDLTFNRSRGVVTDVTIHPPHFLCGEEPPASEPCSSASYAGAPVSSEVAVAGAVAPFIEAARTMRERRLGAMVAARFEPIRNRETPLSNLFADLLLEARDADVGLVNGGGLRAPLPEGELHYGALHETYPFDNRFAMIEMTAADLAALVADNSPSGPEGFLSLAGVRAVVQCEGGAPVTTLLTDEGRPIPPTRVLTVVTNEYLATVDQPVFRRAWDEDRARIEEGPPLRDALAERLERRTEALDPRSPRLAEPRVSLLARTPACEHP